MKAREIARGRWFEILTHFGINAKHLRNKHGECPCCGGHDRFRWDNKNGTGSHFCAGCGSGDGFVLLEKFTGQSFKDLAREVEKFVGVNAEPKVIQIEDFSNAIARLRRIGQALKPLEVGDPVCKYLTKRGIHTIPTEFIKYHPALDYWELSQKLGTYPAMVAAFTRPCGKVESLHTTYLTAEGEKANVASPKKAQGKSSQQGLKGCAIRLSPVVEHIALTEGIETALSVKQLYSIDCWATYSANNMIEFIPPEGVKAITIYPDIDDSFTGQEAAYVLARRLKRQGYSVTVAEHLPVGVDYNDLLLEGLTHAS